MSNRVNQLIEEIHEKANLLKNKVAVEKNKNVELTQEITDLKGLLQTKEDEVSNLRSEIERLRRDIDEKNKQNIAVESGNGVSDEQIDELVKEIEYCITQLKK